MKIYAYEICANNRVASFEYTYWDYGAIEYTDDYGNRYKQNMEFIHDALLEIIEKLKANPKAKITTYNLCWHNSELDTLYSSTKLIKKQIDNYIHMFKIK